MCVGLFLFASVRPLVCVRVRGRPCLVLRRVCVCANGQLSIRTCASVGWCACVDGITIGNVSCVLPCLVLFCLVLSCVVLACLVQCCVVLSCLVLSRIVLSCFVLSCRALSCLALSCLVLSCLVLSRISLCCVVSKRVVLLP